MLRAVKNRFGSTDEVCYYNYIVAPEKCLCLICVVFDLCGQLGVFEMSHSGLQAVSNASEMFLSEQHLDSEILAGLAVAVIMDGSRTFLIEIQVFSLCVH